jgi:F-type H+-transporting ATPase subunit b
MEIIKTLGISWQLLLAQIINFGIILFVLTKFVYKPVLKVIDERREATRKAMDDADKIENQKREMDEIRTEQLRKLDQESGDYLQRAKKQAEKIQTEMLEKAKAEVDTLLERGRKQLESERQEAVDSLQDTLGKVVIRMTEKILEREFGDADQKRLLTNLEKDLPSMLK